MATLFSLSPFLNKTTRRIALDCKSVYTVSIPVLASKYFQWVSANNSLSTGEVETKL